MPHLRDYVRTLAAQRWLLVMALLAGALLGLAWQQRQWPLYRAEATLLLQSGAGAALSEDYAMLLQRQHLAATYAQLLSDWPVAEDAAHSLGLAGSDAWADFGVRIRVEPVRDTSLLRLSVDSYDPNLAWDIARTLPEAFARLQAQAQAQRSAALQRSFDAQMQAAADDVAATQRSLAQVAPSAADSAEARRLQQALQRDRLTFDLLLRSREQARVALLTPAGLMVISPPRRPHAPLPTLSPALAGLIGMTAGLLLALAVVLLLHQLDDTIRRLDDLQAALDVPALAALAALDGESPAQRVVMLHAPLSPAGEGYRVLRTNLQFSAVARPLHTLLITSAGPAEGKSTTAANLALALAQAGRRVILVDADLRRPSQHRLFGKPNNQGLSAALLHPTLSPLAFVCDSGVSGLGLLLAGPLPPNPAELLASRRMQQIIIALCAAADVVIFDTPPILAAADALILAAQMDGTILVTDQGRTRRVFAQQALARLVAVRARLLGAVLNRDSSPGGYDSPVYAEAAAPALTSPARRRLWWRIKPVV